MTNNDSKYTDPELRTQIKESVQDSDKGGKPGQWSARKAQLMASEYKKAMEERGEEPYTTDKSEKDDRQKHLSEWTEEEWQTSDGKAEAKQADGTEKRYLPKKAWDMMSEEEKRETNEAKMEGSKDGKQYVPNTAAAKAARRATDDGHGKDTPDDETLQDEDEDDDESPRAENAKETKTGDKRERAEEDKDAEDSNSRGDQEQKSPDEHPKKKLKANDGKEDHGENRAEEDDSETDIDNSPSNDEQEHGQPGSADRLPEEGQTVYWRSSGAWCEGVVLEVLHEEKEVAGRTAKASQNNPRIVLKSNKSGKSAVHKPGAVYF